MKLNFRLILSVGQEFRSLVRNLRFTIDYYPWLYQLKDTAENL